MESRRSFEAPATPIERRTLALNGLDATTGEPLFPPPTLEQIAALACSERLAAGDLEELRRWRALLQDDHLDVRYGIDPRNLAETGWGVIFPEDRQDELRQALAPLLAWRRSQAARAKELRYRELVYRRGEPKAAFLARHGLGPGPVDPDRMPYYLLLAADPEEISFTFQYQLDVQYAVGRLSFSTMEEYARYAESVVAAEQRPPASTRQASFFSTVHADDPVTVSCLEHLVKPLAEGISRERSDWQVETVVGPQATKAALAERMGGARTPSLLFTASHGLVFPPADPRHRPHQGALVCQEWPGPEAWRGRRIPTDHYLSGDDISDSANPAGLITFNFACFGAGTPCYDSYAHAREGERRRIADESFVARLPQRLLGHPRGGALAVVGHVDLAWTCSFEWQQAGTQIQVFESALGRLLDGYPVGAAMECFNQRYAELSSDLSQEVEAVRWGAEPDVLNLSFLWTANNDARAYVVLGDPAVRLL